MYDDRLIDRQDDMNQYPQSRTELEGLVYGSIGIVVFSLTLPATRIAVADLDPVFVGLGRAIVAAVLASILLIVTRQQLPPRRDFPRYCIVVAGVIVGFPLLSALAMQNAPASQGAVITGLLPLSTALFGVWRAGERPSRQFWIFAIAGSLLVLIFAFISGAGSIRATDWALLGAVFAASLGYVEGAILSRTSGAWQVICWSLVLSVPVLLPIVLQHLPHSIASVSSNAWWAFLYVSAFSMFLGFFAWYRGLALGGIARIGQLQLLQPFLTISASAILLREPLTVTTIGFAMATIGCVGLGRRAAISAK
jgi:drug/metabolite transporter (DMT)-like permease